LIDGFPYVLLLSSCDEALTDNPPFPFDMTTTVRSMYPVFQILGPATSPLVNWVYKYYGLVDFCGEVGWNFKLDGGPFPSWLTLKDVEL